MSERSKQIKARLPRMWEWMIVTFALLALVWWIAPKQLEIVLYKTLLVSLAAVLTFWIDRSLFRRLEDSITRGMDCNFISASRIIVRGLIFVGCVLGVTLGL
jgi:hypothetical protein